MLPRRRSIRIGVTAGLVVASFLIPILWKLAGGDPSQGGTAIEFVQFLSAGAMVAAFWLAASLLLPRLSEFLQSLIATAAYLLLGLLLWLTVHDAPFDAKFAFDLVVLWPTEYALRLVTGS